jgi:hypothetical protein
MRLAVLVAAATLLAACPGTAQATPAGPTVVLHDGPGDVWTFSNVTIGYLPAAQPAADVLRARVTHGSQAVSVRLVFDDLQRVDTQWYYCDIHTPGLTSRFVIEAEEGLWRGRALQQIDGEWVRVPGLSHQIDYGSDVVTLRVSRTLLGRPPWVRVRLRNELGLPDHNTFFTDNPTTAGPTARFTARLHPAAAPATEAGSSGH